jgi:hypothetical protein
VAQRRDGAGRPRADGDTEIVLSTNQAYELD